MARAQMSSTDSLRTPFGWRYVVCGRVTEARACVGDDKLVVGTGKGVVAAVDSTSGSLLWRQPLEDGTAITALSPLDEAHGTVASLSDCKHVHMWNLTDGALINQASLTRLLSVPDLKSAGPIH